MYEKQSTKRGYFTEAEPEENTLDHRNAGTSIKRKGSALVQAKAQCNQYSTHLMILGAVKKNGGISGTVKAFLAYLTKGKKTLTKQQN